MKRPAITGGGELFDGKRDACYRQSTQPRAFPAPSGLRQQAGTCEQTHRKGNNHVEAYTPLVTAAAGHRRRGDLCGTVARRGNARRRTRYPPRRRVARDESEFLLAPLMVTILIGHHRLETQ